MYKPKFYKSIARKYKKGKSHQWVIPLKHGHGFQDHEDVYVIGKDDFNILQDALEKLESFESDKKDLVDRHETEIIIIKNKVDSLNERIDELKQSNDKKSMEIKQAVAFIAMAWAGIQDLRKMKWYQRIGGPPASLIELPKPPKQLIELPEEPPIDIIKD